VKALVTHGTSMVWIIAVGTLADVLLISALPIIIPSGNDHAMRRASPAPLRTAEGRRRVWITCVGSGSGIATSLAAFQFLVGGARDVPVTIAFGLCFLLWRLFRTEFTADAAALTLHQLAWQSLAAVVCNAALGGLAITLVGWPLFPWYDNVAFFPVAALMATLRSDDTGPWLRYAVAVRLARRRGALPARPVLFLDWCLSTGLLRRTGNALQFRHRDHEEWLLRAGADRSGGESPGRPAPATAPGP